MSQGKQHIPDDLTKQKVKLLAQFGCKKKYIAKRLDISINTLKKYYSDVMFNAKIDGDMEVLAALHDEAVNKRIPSILIFYSKQRLGFTDMVEAEDDSQTEEAEALEIKFEVAEAKKDIKVTRGE